VDLRPDPADEAFRAEVRRFVDENLPADLAQRASTGFLPNRADAERWQAILHKRGWSVPRWPVEHGGTGWTPKQIHIFDDELYTAGAPVPNYQGYTLVAPVIYTFGTAEQKQRFLPPIREGTQYWAQGFSEPGSGSDLASMKTRAVRQGDHYIVNGSKIWTTQAHWADWIFLLVKTDIEVKPQRGVSFLLVDAKSPGVTVQPILSIDGCHHLNATFYDDVKVPVENLIGEENRGWDYTKWLLANERAFSGGEVAVLKRYLKKLHLIARAERAGDVPLLQEASFARRLAESEIETAAIEMSVLRFLGDYRADDPRGALVASILKVRCTELQQRMSEFLVEAIGAYGAVFHPDVYEHAAGNNPVPGPDYATGLAADLFYRRAASIYGGTNEVQRNLIAKLGLQL
jgi:alkylation response protein AidB-like acyl-CoA dehydrogenase